MIQLITHYEKNYFRWHDSGDIQSLEHLRKICAVAAGTPHIKHWLPTRENKIVKEYKETGGRIPSNLVIRLSATMINGAPSNIHEHSSTVHTPGVAPIGSACNASHQGGRCLDCRACWDPNIKIYHMKNIKTYIEYFILYLVIYYFIIKPILWLIDKSRED